MDTIKLGVSACLMGEEVRYDGGHKLDRFIRDTLGRYVTFVPVCPETECGLGVPREAMRLVGELERPRLVTNKTGVDHTDCMTAWAGNRLAELGKEDLCGFIFKSKSPSSGMLRVKVYTDGGMPVQKGVGIFARAFIERFPDIPVEDEGRLHDPLLREHFIERIFLYRRLRDLMAGPRTRGALVEFHTCQKLLVMSHSQRHYTEMGRLVASAMPDIDAQFAEYRRLMAGAMELKTTPRKHLNVMMHVMGYFKKELSSDEKTELLEIFEAYRQGHVPLIVPITLLRHYVRKYDQEYLGKQTYLNPAPLELLLRNHV